MMKRLMLAAALALSGAFAAALVGSSSAQAWDVTNLPAGYSTSHWHDSSPPPGSCSDGWNVVGYGSAINLGECDADFQQKLDAFVNGTCPCASSSSTTAAAPTTDASTTTVADPAATTVAVTTTDASPPPQETVSTPAPPVAPTTTDDVSAQITALEARISALEAQIAALTTRVDRITLAGDASWLAYQQAVANGVDPATAADIAHGTWLNAVYGLGDFAA